MSPLQRKLIEDALVVLMSSATPTPTPVPKKKTAAPSKTPTATPTKTPTQTGGLIGPDGVVIYPGEPGYEQAKRLNWPKA